MPRPTYRLAMETTSLRFALISCCFASRPTCSIRIRRRCSALESSIFSSSKSSSFCVASVPASIFIARLTSSDAVRRSTLPISLRYMRTGSPVSITVEVSVLRARAREERLGLEVFALGTDFSASLTCRASLSAPASSSSSSSSSRGASSKSSSALTKSSSETVSENSTDPSDTEVISTFLLRSVS